MGHTGVKRLQSAVDGVNGLPDNIDRSSCTICSRANIKRLPYPQKSYTKAPSVLYRIHSDICGPLSHGYGNHHYFILFIDDYSRLMALYPLRAKSEAIQKFQLFKTQSEKFHGKPIKIFRTDGAGELSKGVMRAFM